MLKPGVAATSGDDKFGVPNPNLLLYTPAFRPPVWPGFFLPKKSQKIPLHLQMH
jgi:hypothetical protein